MAEAQPDDLSASGINAPAVKCETFRLNRDGGGWRVERVFRGAQCRRVCVVGGWGGGGTYLPVLKEWLIKKLNAKKATQTTNKESMFLFLFGKKHQSDGLKIQTL